MITAYFMFDKGVSWKSVLRTITSTVFYGLTFFTIFSCINHSFDTVGFFKALFSFITDEYWFVTAYLVFIIVVPLLAKLVHHLSRQAHFDVCIIGFIVLSVLPALIYCFTGIYLDCLLLYLFYIFPISYVKLYIKKTNKPLLIVILILSYAIGTAMGVLLSDNPNVLCENTITNFLAAFSMFLLFREIKFTSRLVNKLASATFGVYLIHDNRYFKSWLWDFVYSLGQTEKPYWFLFCIAVILAVFVFCTVIELLRQTLFKSMSQIIKRKKKGGDTKN